MTTTAYKSLATLEPTACVLISDHVKLFPTAHATLPEAFLLHVSPSFSISVANLQPCNGPQTHSSCRIPSFLLTLFLSRSHSSLLLASCHVPRFLHRARQCQTYPFSPSLSLSPIPRRTLSSMPWQLTPCSIPHEQAPGQTILHVPRLSPSLSLSLSFRIPSTPSLARRGIEHRAASRTNRISRHTLIEPTKNSGRDFFVSRSVSCLDCLHKHPQHANT